MRILFAALIALTAIMGAVSPASAQPDYRRPAAARAVILRYYAAIDHGDFRTAYLLWDNDGRASSKSYDRFQHGFAGTARTQVNAGRPGAGDAGAGSVYIEIPVEVRAVLKTGIRQHFRGIYTLRRINDVDGAARSRLRWHIASAKLRVIG